MHRICHSQSKVGKIVVPHPLAEKVKKHKLRMTEVVTLNLRNRSLDLFARVLLVCSKTLLGFLI